MSGNGSPITYLSLDLPKPAATSKSQDEMDDKIFIFFVVVLVIIGLMVITVVMVCYVCMFRDLCRSESKSKRRRQQSSRRKFDNPNRVRLDSIPLNDITQGESVPTESEQI